MLAVCLEVQDLHVVRAERTVLRGVSFRAESGTYVEVQGPNGSGKTTLLRAIAQLLPLESGRVLWCGTDVANDRANWLRSLFYLGHDPPLKSDLSAFENLKYWIGLRRAVALSERRAALAEVGMPPAACDRPVRTLSAGQRRRVALAGLLLAQATVWLLDEPTTQLDAAGQSLVAHLVRQHVRVGGIAVVALHGALQPAPVSAQYLRLAA
ncbi:MAG: heme ABC exporter ATP-binding protein CcmA [Steroidobacteraceae bacterium]|nr:heme ABC exporter ATP-binding protein CcmA [Steroidobacteraceae bacterium]MDW8259634.1 heme ABC exporter ATP-binding protein CcmA [Gammaproteobacteria bacterium]